MYRTLFNHVLLQTGLKAESYVKHVCILMSLIYFVCSTIILPRMTSGRRDDSGLIFEVNYNLLLGEQDTHSLKIISHEHIVGGPSVYFTPKDFILHCIIMHWHCYFCPFFCWLYIFWQTEKLLVHLKWQFFSNKIT